MLEILQKVTAGLCVLATLSGCAAGPTVGPGDDEHVLIDVEDQPRSRNVVITIGAILLLGAVIANEVADNVDDAVRDAARP